MKKIYYLTIVFLMFGFVFCNAQVSIDHPIQLTGNGSNARLSGIQNVSNNQDAVSVDYVQRDSLQFAIATGSPSAYLVNLSPAVTSQYTVGMIVHFEANFANTGATTLNVNSLGNITIKKNYNSDLAANDILSGQMVSVIYDGTYFQMLSPVSNSATSGGFFMQIFSSSGTFTVPAGVSNIVIELWGAGGGGSGDASHNDNCPGGGGGGYGKQSFSVSSGTALTVTIGAGGSAGPANGNLSTGGNGGTSSVSGTGVSISATGGNGGTRNYTLGTSSGGTGGTSTAAFNFPGFAGSANVNTGSSSGGNAGGPGGGFGGSATTSNSNGQTGGFPGGGGSGAMEGNSTTLTGGAGAGGGVIIYY